MECTLAFVDDTAFLAIGKNFNDTHATLKDMINRAGGGYEWAQNHNSCFETSKFTLINFSMNKEKNHPLLILGDTTINLSPTVKFLGVILDQVL